MRNPILRKKHFYEHYQEILRGEDGDWYLYSFEVSPGCLILDFHYSQNDCSCYLIFGEISRLKAEFDVPKRDGTSESHYEVGIFNVPESSTPSITKKTARVTEYFGGVRRILEFHKRSDDPVGKEHYMYITEYAVL